MSNNIKLKRSYDTKFAERLYKECFEKDREFTVKELEEDCYFLVDGEKGGMFFWKMHYATHEAANAIFTPYRRGNYTLEFTRQCFDWMFNETDCLLIIGKTPIENKPAQTLARNLLGGEVLLPNREGKVWRLWRIGNWIKHRPDKTAKAALKKQSRKFGRNTQGGNPNG